MRVETAQLDPVLDRLLMLLPYGVHSREDGEATILVALGEPHQLSPVETLVDALGGLLLDAPVETSVDDLHHELDRLRPSFRIGDRLVVRPPLAPAPEPGIVDVVIARSMGFGTGAHPTTQLVLELLLDLEPGGAFGDLGCGAGAVAVSAAKLGWGPVWGVDFSDAGVAEARANAERNGVEATFTLGDLRTPIPLPPARVAVVNVTEDGVHPAVARRDWTGLETLVISGLRRDRDLDPALEAYLAAGFVAGEVRESGRWVAVVLDHRGLS